MDVLARTPRPDPQWLQRTLREATDVAGGYAGRHPWQLAAAGAALGAVAGALLRRAGRRHVQPRDYSDGG
jgi:ElaB/YqjD/DUF883 family membrane-anchored ribosome-binding protein